MSRPASRATVLAVPVIAAGVILAVVPLRPASVLMTVAGAAVCVLAGLVSLHGGKQRRAGMEERSCK